jgi:hypothetical protein
MKKVFLLFAVASQLALATPAKHITSPEEAFGFKPGTDRKLADWSQLTAYFQKIANESDRIRYAEVGKTTEGRPFIAVTISAPENLAHIERYREIQRKNWQIREPRRRKKPSS